jgi:hypothetical protein
VSSDPIGRDRAEFPLARAFKIRIAAGGIHGEGGEGMPTVYASEKPKPLRSHSMAS